MDAMQRYAWSRTGLGDDTFDPFPLGGSNPILLPSIPATGRPGTLGYPGVGGGSAPWWQSVLAAGTGVANNLIQYKFAKDASRSTGQFAPTSAYVNQPQGGGNALSPQELAALAAANRNGGGNIASLGFTNNGLRLGQNTVISYPVIGLGVLALVLVQHSGFQKRR